MIVRVLRLALLLAIVGCGRMGLDRRPGTDGPATDGGSGLVDARVPDGQVAMRDARMGDGLDASIDMDAMVTEAGTDSSVDDSSMDGGGDGGSGAADAASDAMVEAGTDVMAEAGLDAMVEAGVEAGTDAHVEAGVEAGVDAGVQCEADPDPALADSDGDGLLDVFDPDDDNDGIPDSDECFAQPPQLLANNGFEEPVLGDSWAYIAQDVVPAWSTSAADDLIELWQSGHNGVVAAEGQQFAECNANIEGALYQDVATVPGTTLRWAFYHRGRGGTDTLELKIGPPGATTTEGTFATANDAWRLYAGTYVVPADQTVTRFEYNCEAQLGTVGNLLDAAFMEPECTLDSDNDGCPDSRDVD
ncbi:MAG: hypothetical protein OXU20_02740 [Myxococcales bacterium]|nr:hypothetical protein [Myxococcales bacterium]